VTQRRLRVPKLKTHKGAKRRFRFTGTGKIVRMKVGSSHFRRRKHSKVKRQYGSKFVVHPTNVRQIKQALPNGLPK
jgi:large subunit ribosomal protein L35